MSRTLIHARFDFRKRVAYDPEAKRLFHTQARRRLLELAAALGFTPCAFDLRSNAGRHRRLRRSHAACRPSLRAGEPAGDRQRYRHPVPQRARAGAITSAAVNNFASLDLLHRPDRARRLDPAPLPAPHPIRGSAP